MKRLLTLAALTATVALTACGGGAGSSSALPAVASLSPASASNVQGGSAGRSVKDLAGGVLGVSVSLYDAPPPWHNAQVNVAIVGVDLVSTSNVAYPVETFSTPKIVDLLSLKHHPLPLAGSVPAGSYSTLRLLIDPTKSALAIGGKTYPFVWKKNAANMPSLVAIDAPVSIGGRGGESVSLTADFNVLESLKFKGGQAEILPQLVAAQNAATIEGKLVNDAGKPVSSAAVQAVDVTGKVVNSTLSLSDGSFAIRALPAGTYTVVVLNQYTGTGGTEVEATNADASAAPSEAVDLSPNSTTMIGLIED